LVIGFAFLRFVSFQAVCGFGRTHQRAQTARAAIERGVIVVGIIQKRLRAAMGERGDVLKELIPAFTQGGCPVLFVASFLIRFRSIRELVFHHGAKDKAAPVLVDNYSPTQGFMKEFNRNEVKCCTVTRLIGVEIGGFSFGVFRVSSRALRNTNSGQSRGCHPVCRAA
jgi:hypothetical protein